MISKASLVDVGGGGINFAKSGIASLIFQTYKHSVAPV